MADLARAHLIISGEVQGVGFRYWAVGQARRLGIHGFVRNLTNGRVEAEIEGDRRKLEEFVAWCHRGPTSARVEQVEATWSEHRGEYTGFVSTG